MSPPELLNLSINVISRRRQRDRDGSVIGTGVLILGSYISAYFGCLSRNPSRQMQTPSGVISLENVNRKSPTESA